MRKKILVASASLVMILGGGFVASSAYADPIKPQPVKVAPPTDMSLTATPAETPGQIFKKKIAAEKKADPSLTDAQALTKAKAKFVKSPSKTPSQRLGAPVYKGMPQQTPKSVKATKGGVSTLATPCTSGCYLYNGGRQDLAATITGGANYRGVSAQARVGGDPGTLDLRNDRHSLGEIAVQGANRGNIVEIGWTVDPVVNGSYDSTLFVFSWVDGNPGCYNLTCGNFAQVIGASFVPGTTKMTVGSNYTLSYIYDNTPGIEGWWAAVGGNWIGYYPDYLWVNATPTQTFRTSPYTQIFFEIATTVQEPCSDMGNGELGASTTASRWGNTAYYNASGTLTTTGVNLNTFREGNGGAPHANASAPYYNTFGEGPAGAQRAYRAGGGGWNFAGTAVGANGTCN